MHHSMHEKVSSLAPPSCLHAPRRATTAAGGAAPSIAPAVAPSIVPFFGKLVLACIDVIVMTVSDNGEVMCCPLPADQSIPLRPPDEHVTNNGQDGAHGCQISPDAHPASAVPVCASRTPVRARAYVLQPWRDGPESSKYHPRNSHSERTPDARANT